MTRLWTILVCVGLAAGCSGQTQQPAGSTAGEKVTGAQRAAGEKHPGDLPEDYKPANDLEAPLYLPAEDFALADINSDGLLDEKDATLAAVAGWHPLSEVLSAREAVNPSTRQLRLSHRFAGQSSEEVALIYKRADLDEDGTISHLDRSLVRSVVNAQNSKDKVHGIVVGGWDKEHEQVMSSPILNEDLWQRIIRADDQHPVFGRREIGGWWLVANQFGLDPEVNAKPFMGSDKGGVQ